MGFQQFSFTPNPNLFNQTFGGGLRNGAGLVQLINDRRAQQRRGKLAEIISGGLNSQEDFNAAAAILAQNGDTGAAIRAVNIPFNREQQQLQRDFQNAQFQALRGDADRRFSLDEQRLQIARDNAERQGAANFTKPIQAVDVEGNPVFIQTNDRGEVQELEGFSPNNPIKTIDTGTHVNVIDSRTGVVLSSTPKNNIQEASDKAEGTVIGKAKPEARADVISAKKNLDKVRGIVSALKDSPGAQNALGVIQGELNPVLAASVGFLTGGDFNPQDIANFRALQDQLAGGAFLQAFESIKGGGHITEIEGQKATQAIIAAQSTQSPEEFFKQLDIFTKELEKGVKLAQERSARLNAGPAIDVPSPNQPKRRKFNPVTGKLE